MNILWNIDAESGPVIAGKAKNGTRLDEKRMSKWLKNTEKINKSLQAAANAMTKESMMNNPGAQYVLNSYAFHSKPLINTLLTFLPSGFEKSKVEQIFVENSNSSDNHH